MALAPFFVYRDYLKALYPEVFKDKIVVDPREREGFKPVDGSPAGADSLFEADPAGVGKAISQAGAGLAEWWDDIGNWWAGFGTGLGGTVPVILVLIGIIALAIFLFLKVGKVA